MDPAEFGG